MLNYILLLLDLLSNTQLFDHLNLHDLVLFDEEAIYLHMLGSTMLNGIDS